MKKGVFFVAKWDEIIAQTRALIQQEPVAIEEIKALMARENLNNTYYFRQFKAQCMEIVSELGITEEKKRLIVAAINHGIEVEYEKTHFVSEDEMLDWLEKLVYLGEFETVKNGSICADFAYAFFGLAWNGWKEKDILEIKKEDLLYEKSCILHQGNEIPVSSRLMNILQLYADAEGVHRRAKKAHVFYHYPESIFLFRTTHVAALTPNGARLMRRNMVTLAKAIDFAKRFEYEQISINGVMVTIYEWEKETGIPITPSRIRDAEIVESIFGEKRHVLPDLFTIVSKHYPTFRNWMNDKEKIE